jgi:thiamine biosynthesis protein ThiI
VKPGLVIIRYGEIGLKQNITRRFFENTLIKNIKHALQKKKINFEIEIKRARIYVVSNQIEDCLKVLPKIFGIRSFSPAYKTNSDKKSLEKLALKLIENKISKDTSFALKVNRTGNHDFTSQDVAIQLGSLIQKAKKAPVNLSKPDVRIFIEIIGKEAFFFFEKIPGVGGLPLGTQGIILSYIDSKEAILASWYLMRRGCKPLFLIKNNSLLNTVEIFSKNWFCKCYIEAEDIIDFDEYLKQKNCDAIATGYKTNDIEKINQLKKQIKAPVLHPLVGLNDEEIAEKLKEIEL